MRTNSLGTGVENTSGFQSLAEVDVTNAVKAQDSMRVLDQRWKSFSTRAEIGAFQKNNLESNLNYLRIAHENVMSSESVIRDADMAEEMTKFTRNQIMTVLDCDASSSERVGTIHSPLDERISPCSCGDRLDSPRTAPNEVSLL